MFSANKDLQNDWQLLQFIQPQLHSGELTRYIKNLDLNPAPCLNYFQSCDIKKCGF